MGSNGGSGARGRVERRAWNAIQETAKAVWLNARVALGAGNNLEIEVVGVQERDEAIGVVAGRTSERSCLNAFVMAREDDGEGGVWIGSQGQGLFRHRDGTFVRHAATDDTIQALLPGKRGEVWIGTPHGLARYVDGKTEWFTAKDGLSHANVTALPRGSRWESLDRHRGRWPHALP
jgi:ligand-binding sensor domain-containing protein